MLLAIGGTGLALAAGAAPATVTLTPDASGHYACKVALSGTTYDCKLQLGAAAPAPAPAPTPTPAPAPAPQPAPAPATGSERIIPKAYVTGYGWWDNTPRGSSEISNPVLHKKAGGTGTYADPVTIAVGHSLVNGKDILDYPQGTRIYIPSMKKYFIVEDTCGDGRAPQNIGCHKLYNTANGNDAAPGNTTWVDVWIGGSTATQATSDACEEHLTGSHTIIVNPKSTYSVVAGDVLLNGVCRDGYGNTAR